MTLVPTTRAHRLRSGSGTQHAPGVVVEKDAVEVEAVADGGYGVPLFPSCPHDRPPAPPLPPAAPTTPFPPSRRCRSTGRCDRYHRRRLRSSVRHRRPHRRRRFRIAGHRCRRRHHCPRADHPYRRRRRWLLWHRLLRWCHPPRPSRRCRSVRHSHRCRRPGWWNRNRRRRRCRSTIRHRRPLRRSPGPIGAVTYQWTPRQRLARRVNRVQHVLLHGLRRRDISRLGAGIRVGAGGEDPHKLVVKSRACALNA
jgi:hypothetical protein